MLLEATVELKRKENQWWEDQAVVEEEVEEVVVEVVAEVGVEVEVVGEEYLCRDDKKKFDFC